MTTFMTLIAVVAGTAAVAGIFWIEFKAARNRPMKPLY